MSTHGANFARAPRPCTGCLPARRGRCHNTAGLVSSSQSPSFHRLDHSSQQSSSPPSTQLQQLSPPPHPPEGSQSPLPDHSVNVLTQSDSQSSTTAQDPLPLTPPAVIMPQLLPTIVPALHPPLLSSSTLQGLPFPGPYQPPSTSRQAFSDLPRQCASPEPVVLSRPSSASSPLLECLIEPHPVITHRKQCIVDGCQEFIAPTMWRSHMNLHAKGVFPGEVPTWWLQEQNLTVCTNCFCLVAVSRFRSHLDRCSTIGVSGCRSFPHSSPGVSCPSENPLPALPTWEEVCELQCPTIRYIPHKARPAVAHVLSDVLRSICFENSEEAWLKLFMLPKCVL